MTRRGCVVISPIHVYERTYTPGVCTPKRNDASWQSAKSARRPNTFSSVDIFLTLLSLLLPSARIYRDEFTATTYERVAPKARVSRENPSSLSFPKKLHIRTRVSLNRSAIFTAMHHACVRPGDGPQICTKKVGTLFLIPPTAR